MTRRTEGCRKLESELPFQRAEWRVERVGFAGLLLVIAAALLGLIGTGPLSDAAVGNGTPLRLEYARFGRQGQASELRVDVARRGEGGARIWFDRPYLDGVEIDGVVPEPVESTSDGQAGIDDDDILAAARDKRGLDRMDQIQFAVLETSGEITIIPRRDG